MQVHSSPERQMIIWGKWEVDSLNALLELFVIWAIGGALFYGAIQLYCFIFGG